MMKTIQIILITALVVCNVFFANAQQIAQSRRIKKYNAGLSTLPVYFPLAKKGFKRISSNFGMRDHPVVKKRKFHSGLDLAAKSGTPIYASAKGKVIVSSYSDIYGNYVQLSHGSRYKTLYGHMLKRVVRENQWVKQGQIIGYVGSTGRSTGPHLHFEILDRGKKIDPFSFWKNIVNLKSVRKVYSIK